VIDVGDRTGLVDALTRYEINEQSRRAGEEAQFSIGAGEVGV
jgi:hypothetical protein